MIRRNFLKATSTIGAAGLLQFNKARAKYTAENFDSDRAYWVHMLTKITLPGLQALSAKRLKILMPVEAKEGALNDRKKVTYLEALGRTLAGLAPWLELGPDDTNEGKLRKQFIELAAASVKNAVDPSSPDYMNFTEGGQSLVDAAFLAHALIRAPKQLWGNLDTATRILLTNALQSTRSIQPPQTNWLLFSAMIEAALLKFTNTYNESPVTYALQQHEAWYKGDSIYGDGAELAFDYYNSFVIQPMLLDITATVNEATRQYGDRMLLYEKRSQRYAEIQERFISPEGAFPPVGRSLAYRCGAFQLLAQLALQQKLPASLQPALVRSALTAVIKKSMDAPGTFDNNGWLTIGFCGHQPDIAELYISTGSLYLCTVAFLPLGLPATDAFWADGAMEWTSKKAYLGKSFPIDHALK
ncbi:DUF2264 domain-containing protein [Panacibacter ginsenosidivorans]|uniref:DUF2264 domain-containing protein n=1 Tax=Panacibacter ginsenosidivorans TaxID=1813871 RepID=A0A5B8VBM7_9BACT|nr:DUF2264 domain-containing protein [Panacibacter ginsenosidivorans]QEC68331.1 DUF2264 domain-containing protein [Panacibacter ginsenosidivorans]